MSYQDANAGKQAFYPEYLFYPAVGFLRGFRLSFFSQEGSFLPAVFVILRQESNHDNVGSKMAKAGCDSRWVRLYWALVITA